MFVYFSCQTLYRPRKDIWVMLTYFGSDSVALGNRYKKSTRALRLKPRLDRAEPPP